MSAARRRRSEGRAAELRPEKAPSLKTSPWRPILRGEAARRALAAAEAIASDLFRLPASGRHRNPKGKRRTDRDASLAGGSAGHAIFFAYLGRTHARYERTARRFLEEAAHALAAVRMGPSLYGGFAGIGWTIAHLERQLFEPDSLNSTAAIDEALADYVGRPGWQRDYDLISGLVGLGVYALERLPAPHAVACAERIVDRLKEISDLNDAGIVWHTPPELLPLWQREQCPNGYDNLGLAHGVPGVIAFLGAACAAGIRKKRARKLLDGAVAWLLRHERRSQAGSRFSAWIPSSGEREDCRSAWCYGDPGVAAALFWAARGVGQRAWEEKALRIARAAAARRPEDAGVQDAGLCHGAAGLAHVFNRLYQATGDAALRRAARYWIEKTLAMRHRGRGIGGFQSLQARDDRTRYWEDDPGLLTGSAGIGLALLAAATPIEPEWDRILLLSMRSVGEKRKGESQR